MKTLAGMLTAVAALALAATANAAPLLGTPVTGSLTPLSSTSITTQFTSPAIVTNATEFTGVVRDTAFGQDFNIAADFSDDALIISITSADGFANVRGGDRLRINFGSALALFTPSGDFTRTSCNPSFCQYTGLNSFAANSTSITATFSGLFVGDVYRLNLSAVPEPTSWAMMILGVGVVGGSLRRRGKVSTTVKFA